MNNTSNEDFWINNFSELFDNNKFLNFVPIDGMSLNSKLNSLMRLSIYLCIILFIYNKNYLNIYIIFIMGLFTYFLHNYYDSDENYSNNDEKKIYMSDILKDFNMPNENIYFNKNNEKKIKCIKPSIQNPFMNRLLYDKYPDVKNCSIFDKNIDNKIEDYFNNNLYKDVGDIFNTNNSRRQYYTTPITNKPNDQKDFANWLYNTPETCKQGNSSDCLSIVPNIVNTAAPNIKLRYN